MRRLALTLAVVMLGMSLCSGGFAMNQVDLTRIPTATLVACFNEWELCQASDAHPSGWPISDEVARRGDPHDLLVRYWTEPNQDIRAGIEHVAYHFDSPEIVSFMKRVLDHRVDGGEGRYWPINYLAKRCDMAALKQLSRGGYRTVGSLQYQTSVELFGKCKFRPAIPYLVDQAIYDISLNVVVAGEHSLHALYPDAPAEFDSMREMQNYFCQRARQDKLKVRCKLREK